MAASGTVCFEVLASAQAALAEILGPENVSRGLPEATAEAVLAKMTDLFVQLVRETAAETAGQPGARRTGPGAASAATGVPRANFGAQPEPDNRDLPEPEKSHLEANPTGEVQVQVVTVTAGNKAATWTGSLRSAGADPVAPHRRDGLTDADPAGADARPTAGSGQQRPVPVVDEQQWATWEDKLQAHADALYGAAPDIVAMHHQSPPVDQSADASPQAREYAGRYRLIVQAVARVLRDGGEAQTSLSPKRRRKLAVALSDLLSRDLGTRARRSAAPPGGAHRGRGNYAAPDSAGAGPSRTTRIPAAGPTSRRRTSTRPWQTPGLAARRPREVAIDPAQQLLALVRNRLREEGMPDRRIGQIPPELISTLSEGFNHRAPAETRAAQIADLIVVNGLDGAAALLATQPNPGSTAATALRPEDALTGEYSSGRSRGRSHIPFVEGAVRMRPFARSADRPAGISLAGEVGTDYLHLFLAHLWTVQRDFAPFDSFLLQAPARDAMDVDEAGGGLIVAPPWHADSRRGGTFFVGLRGSVTGRNGVPLFGIAAERGGTLGVDAAVLARLLLSDAEFAEALDEDIASVTLLGWDNGIPATLARNLAEALRGPLAREVSVYAATGTVVVGQRSDEVIDRGYIGVADGGHWQVSGYRDPSHDSGIASELGSALAKRWRYARPSQAEVPVGDRPPIDDSDRYHTLELTGRVLLSIGEGLANGGDELRLEDAAHLVRQHVNPYLPVLAALKSVTRDRDLARSVRWVRDTWTVQEDGTEKLELFPVAAEFWRRLGATPGQATRNGRAVISEPNRTAAAMAGRLTIRPGDHLTAGVGFDLAALARQLAEAVLPGLGGVSEHADIVVHGGAAGDVLARDIRERLVSATKSYLATLGIGAPGVAEQVILPPRPATDPDDDGDLRVEVVIRSRAELVLEAYPWLPLVNPRRGEGGNYVLNCTLAAIEVDNALSSGTVTPVPAASRSHKYIYDWAKSNDRDFFRIGRGLGAIIDAMRGARPNARALVVVYYRNLPGHAFNAVVHPRLGVVFLDGQISSADPLRQMRNIPEAPSQTWFVPTTDDIGGIEEVGVPLSPEDFKFMGIDEVSPSSGPLTASGSGTQVRVPPSRVLMADTSDAMRAGLHQSLKVLRFGSDGAGRRVNLADLATQGQLDAIARRGGLASHDAVEALAKKAAAKFTRPGDGPDGPPADVPLTLDIPAGRTPDSITSSGQIVQAVATKLKHPVFMHLTETGVEFKICW
jgi:hypothetical protein